MSTENSAFFPHFQRFIHYSTNFRKFQPILLIFSQKYREFYFFVKPAQRFDAPSRPSCTETADLGQKPLLFCAGTVKLKAKEMTKQEDSRETVHHQQERQRAAFK
ncbi:hypothetical protein [Butyricicoccus sp.]|uniref:hypothetical protein n=1 Tax=Butyricicoccus sp. TaxID=2049021 RepID=UPI003D7C86AF